MKSTHKIAATVIATMSLAVASAVLAHPGPGMGMGMGIGPGMGAMGGMFGHFGPGGRMAGADPAAAVVARMGEFKTELKITATQEPGWQVLTGTTTQQAQAMSAMRGKMHETSGSAPERMALRSEFMKQRIGNMDAMAGALKDLYAVLTPEQKAIADKRFDMMVGYRMAGGSQRR